MVGVIRRGTDAPARGGAVHVAQFVPEGLAASDVLVDLGVRAFQHNAVRDPLDDGDVVTFGDCHRRNYSGEHRQKSSDMVGR